MRVTILEFLDTDIFDVSIENCVSFLDPLIESWDIDLETFGMEIVLNQRVASEHLKKFEFVEKEPEQLSRKEPGLTEFLQDASLSGDATEEEIEFLKKLSSRKNDLPRSITTGSCKTSETLSIFAPRSEGHGNLKCEYKIASTLRWHAHIT